MTYKKKFNDFFLDTFNDTDYHYSFVIPIVTTMMSSLLKCVVLYELEELDGQ